MISVVIPTQNEAARIGCLLERLNEMPHIGEIIVTDGGSTDETVAIAQSLGAIVISGAKGRGPQLNLGASHAKYETFWFLHGDCQPARGCSTQIEKAVINGAIGGNFRVHFAARGIYPRLFERIARIQRKFGIYYGDSGIWVRREIFEELGGFQHWPLFEDYDLVHRLEAHGKTVCLSGRIIASARRFEKSPFKILCLWLELQLRFRLGQSPHELARLYREKSA